MENSSQFVEDVFQLKKYDLIHTAHIMHTLYSQQQSGHLCDLSIVVENTTYFVHRCVFATASEQLRTQINTMNTIELVGVTKRGFEFLVEIVYTGKINALASFSLESFHELLKAADALDAGSVLDYCMREHPEFMTKILQTKENENVEMKTVSHSKRLSALRRESLKSDTAMGKLRISRRNATPRLHSEEDKNASTVTRLSVVSKDTSASENEIDPQKPLECPGCGKMFRSNSNVRRHLTLGSCSSGRDYCVYCLKKYKRPQDLKKHITMCPSFLKKSKDQTPTCTICNKKYKRYQDLKKHLTIYHSTDSDPGTPAQASPAKPTLKPVSEQSKDMVKIKNGKYQCKSCVKSFDSENSVVKHWVQMHRSSYRCKICEKLFFNFKIYRAHKAAKNCKASDFKCKLCHATFKRAQDLKVHHTVRHRSTPIAPPSYTCRTCRKKFATRSELSEHTKEHEKDEIPPVSKVLKSDDNEPTSTEDEGFGCIHCGMVFDSLTAMRKHTDEKHKNGFNDVKVFDILESTDQKLFNCKICNQNFESDDALEKHLPSHDKITCEKCYVQFNSKSDYDIHVCIKEEITSTSNIIKQEVMEVIQID